MHEIKKMFMNELYEYEEKAKKMPNAKFSNQDLERIRGLTDSVKNICKIDAFSEDEGYSEDGEYMGEGRIYGMSYARGRNRRRDSMGRYSRDDGMSYDGMSYARQGGNRGGYSRDGASKLLMEKAEEMLEMSHDPKERKAIEKFMRELED